MLGDVDGGFISSDSDIPAGEMFRLAAEYVEAVQNRDDGGYVPPFVVSRWFRDNLTGKSDADASLFLPEYHVVARSLIEGTENEDLITELTTAGNRDGFLRVGDGGSLYNRAAAALINTEARKVDAVDSDNTELVARVDELLSVPGDPYTELEELVPHLLDALWAAENRIAQLTAEREI